MILRSIMTHKFYSTTIEVNGWATFTVYGPFHRHRATKIVKLCELKTLELIIEEQIRDKTNVIETLQ